MKFWWNTIRALKADVAHLRTVNEELYSENAKLAEANARQDRMLAEASRAKNALMEQLDKFKKFDHTDDGKINPGGGPKGGLKKATSKRKPPGG